MGSDQRHAASDHTGLRVQPAAAEDEPRCAPATLFAGEAGVQADQVPYRHDLHPGASGRVLGGSRLPLAWGHLERMDRRRPVAGVAFPLFLTAALLAAPAAAAPPLSDPTGAELPPLIHLTVPWLYWVLAPFFTLWDGISMLSMSRLRGFLLGL